MINIGIYVVFPEYYKTTEHSNGELPRRKKYTVVVPEKSLISG